MDLDDPELPEIANAWALIGADQVKAWGEILQHDPGADATGQLALTLLAVVEGQARLIGDLVRRVEVLEDMQGI